jgi:hypothetical protein
MIAKYEVSDTRRETGVGEVKKWGKGDKGIRKQRTETEKTEGKNGQMRKKGNKLEGKRSKK